MQRFIGIDIGTTNTKSIVFTEMGEVTGMASQGYPLLSPQPGWAEQDPQVIFAAVMTTLKQAIAQSGASASEIAAIGFSSAMHSLIVMDGENRPLTPSITWADNRSLAQAEALKEGAFSTGNLGFELYQRTGTPIHPMSPLTKLLWLRQSAPELFARAAKFISIKEFILYQWFGRYVVDYSIASATGLFNLSQLDWDTEALALAGIQPDHLSELVPATDLLRGMKPQYAESLGLHPDTPVAVGANDGALANLGVGAVSAQHSSQTIDDNPIAVTIGTSAAIRQIVSKPLLDAQGRTFCYNLTSDRWIIGGASNNGGIALRWFRDAFCAAEVAQAKQTGGDVYNALIQEASTVTPGAEGLLFLPFLTGERAPYWNAQARGLFFGAAFHHRRSHFTRAVLEGVLFNLHSIGVILGELTGNRGAVYASGGFARSKVWLQIMADLFGAPVLVPRVTEASGFGAAVIAMLAVGAIQDLSEVQKMVQVDDRYEPNHSFTERYQKLFEIYQRLYIQTVEEMNQLARLTD